MELIQYWRVVRRWAWLIILCPLVTALSAGLISLQLPKIYEAQVSLLVRPAQPLSVDAQTGSLLSPDQILRTYARWITERPVLQQVITDQGLQTDPTTLAKQITVTPEANTTILDVAVRDTDPVRAMNTANTLVNDFIAVVKEVHQKANSPSATASPSSSTANSSGSPTTTNPEDLLYPISPAVRPDQPVSPKPLLNVALGILAGLVVGLGLAFLLDYLDQSVRNDEALTEKTGLLSLGHIAYVPAKSERRGELVALAGNSPVKEAYKSLRTNLLFSSVDREIKTLVITSASPNEGKSRTAANLAVVLAEAGHPTLLVDADFRRPSQHRFFGRVRNMGLSNLIVQDQPESALLQADEQVPGLVVLASGPTPPNPSELLGSLQMKELLLRFRKGFDYVILDTPPVNSVTDASVVAANSDATIVVVETNKATYPAVEHAKQALERVGAKVIGSVMNKMKAAGGDYYYQYGYGYGTVPNGKGPAGADASKAKTPVGAEGKKGP